ncbi:(Dimethylallyl)adenosine tRNA methylthiotransferase MiaB [bacterium BMS3Abin01]|nr:(Dimethylallyl)adenosine tRNA methylthiotransferase MiaB [bacterium BMS3Abin01]
MTRNNRKKITLLYPRNHFDKVYHPWTWAPLPIMAVSAPLFAEGYDVVLLDANLEPHWRQRLVEECRGSLMLGISCMTGPQIHFGLEAAKAVRQAGLKLPIIWGGYHPSILPEQTSRNRFVDAVVRGQGELTLLALAGRLSQGEDFSDLEGITFTREGETVSNPGRKVADINRFPRLPYEKLEQPRRYLNNMHVGSRVINYVSSQGCPSRCQFCAEPLVYGRRWKAYTPDRVLADLEFLESFLGVNGIMYFDSTYFVNERRAVEISQKMVEKGMRFGWAANARAPQLGKFEDATFDVLKQSGLWAFLVGAESGSETQLHTMQKDIEPRDILEAARVATRHGVKISYSYIVGFPGESEQEIEETWQVMEQVSRIVGEYNSQLHFYAPTPGNALYDRALELGLEGPGSLEEWAAFSTVKGGLPWMSKSFQNRMKQREFYLVYGYPSEWVRRRAARSRLRAAYVKAATGLSSARCRRQYWGLPIDWWLLRGVRGAVSSE